jgi:hypothetical protein
MRSERPDPIGVLQAYRIAFRRDPEDLYRLLFSCSHKSTHEEVGLRLAHGLVAGNRLDDTLRLRSRRIDMIGVAMYCDFEFLTPHVC